jgi:hypothetical protein
MLTLVKIFGYELKKTRVGADSVNKSCQPVLVIW